MGYIRKLSCDTKHSIRLSQRKTLHGHALNNVAKSLGFRRYSEYLASALWNSIERRVIESQPCCAHCGESSSRAFLLRHDYATLRGDTLGCIMALCEGCYIRESGSIGSRKRIKRLRELAS